MLKQIDLDLSKATMCSKQGGRTAVDGWVIIHGGDPLPGGVTALANSGHDVVRCSQWPDCADCKASRTRVLTEQND